jgi:CRISPR-associated endonuclease/helicase Cas3
VKQAQDVYKALKVSENEKLLFHSRFMACDRQRITERVLNMFGKDSKNRPEKFVLVATQVVEQSLDVDFDHMISEIAPMDLLLQRSGRIKRHARTKEGKLINTGDDERGQPVLHVLIPEEGSLNLDETSYVYAEKPLLRTLAILADTREVRLPQDFRVLIERCYGYDEWEQSAVPWEQIRKADDAWCKETKSLEIQGKHYVLCAPNEQYFQPVFNKPSGDDSDDGNGWRAKTRIGANERTAILVDESNVEHIESGELPMSEVRSLYQRSIKLPSYLPLRNPSEGFRASVEARGKLKGLVLLPLNADSLWEGVDEKQNRYQVTYNQELGLIARRVQ